MCRTVYARVRARGGGLSRVRPLFVGLNMISPHVCEHSIVAFVKEGLPHTHREGVRQGKGIEEVWN